MYPCSCGERFMIGNDRYCSYQLIARTGHGPVPKNWIQIIWCPRLCCVLGSSAINNEFRLPSIDTVNPFRHRHWQPRSLASDDNIGEFSDSSFCPLLILLRSWLFPKFCGLSSMPWCIGYNMYITRKTNSHRDLSHLEDRRQRSLPRGTRRCCTSNSNT